MAEQLVKTCWMSKEKAVIHSITVGLGLLLLVPALYGFPWSSLDALLAGFICAIAGLFCLWLGLQAPVQLWRANRLVGKFVRFDAAHNRILPQESPLIWTGLVVGCFEQYNKVHYILTSFLSEEIRSCPASMVIETVEVETEEMLTCENTAIRLYGLQTVEKAQYELFKGPQYKEFWKLLWERQLIDHDEYEKQMRDFAL